MTKPFPNLPAEDSHPSEDPARWVSALADGDASAVPEAALQWRSPQQADQFRQTWHSYHLIGDVMRSEELAQTAQHDRAFLQALRGRLAQEATPLAPGSAMRASERAALAADDPADPVAESLQVVRKPVPATRSGQRWVMPAAALAGVAGVALVAASLFLEQRSVSGPAVAALPSVVPSGVPMNVTVSNGLVERAGVAQPPQGLVMAGSDGVIRDPRLEEFLRAHQAARGGVSAAMPAGVLRRVEVVAPVPSAGQ
jgi:sigma-E factor negative regulatory protein RseA